MFNFWKPKPPMEFLANVLGKLDGMSDHKKLGYIQKNIVAIVAAMEKDPQPISDFFEDIDNTTPAAEYAKGYLDWHYDILAALCDEDDNDWNTSALSPAAQFFLNETKADAEFSFQQIFQINPVVAIKNLAPAMLYKTTILRAMDGLLTHENPQLFFDCLDAIDYSDDIADISSMSLRLLHTSYEVLGNLMDKDAQMVIFPAAHAGADMGSRMDYLFYLPGGVYRQRFITEYMSQIDTAVRKVAKDVSDDHLRDFNEVCYSFPEETRPSQLTELKNLLLSERVKTCFRMAAENGIRGLSQPVLALDGEKSEYVKIYSHYDEEPFTPVYECIRLTNPSALDDIDDSDEGADAKYLWMIRKSDRVLVAAFSKAGIIRYINSQTEFTAKELPNAQEFENFLYEPTAQLQ